MQKIVWVFFLASFLLTPTAFADMWDNTLSDFEMFNQQLQYDSDALSVEQEAALLNESTDLFPLTEEEEESSKADNYSQSDTHVTIKVNGVPVILDDVPAFEWFASYVRDAAERGIVSGYKQANGLPSGKYGPADNVTIAQLAKMAVIAASIDTYGCLNEIQNEPATQDWSAPYIRCAENEGWAVYSDGTVDIFRPATRAEVVVTVLRHLSSVSLHGLAQSLKMSEHPLPMVPLLKLQQMLVWFLGIVTVTEIQQDSLGQAIQSTERRRQRSSH